MTLHLDLTDGTTFTTHDAILDSGTWNGYPVPYLPEWHAYLVHLLLDECAYMPRIASGRRTRYVRMDGLTWYV